MPITNRARVKIETTLNIHLCSRNFQEISQNEINTHSIQSKSQHFRHSRNSHTNREKQSTKTRESARRVDRKILRDRLK